MIRLIKAEWYKLAHTGILKYFILACVMFPVMTMMTDLNWYKMTLSENIFLFSQNAAIMMPMFLAIAINIPISQSYQNKTAYYEIMDGRKTYQIIFSKIILYTLIFVVGITVTSGIYFSILGITNGVGDMSDIPLRFILFELTIIRVCIVSVLICMLVKNIIGVVIAILRFMMLDSLVVTIMTTSDSGLTFANSQSASDWFVCGQIMKMFGADIDNRLILIIILTFILEIAFWYALTHISYKKRLFK